MPLDPAAHAVARVGSELILEEDVELGTKMGLGEDEASVVAALVDYSLLRQECERRGIQLVEDTPDGRLEDAVDGAAQQLEVDPNRVRPFIESVVCGDMMATQVPATTSRDDLEAYYRANFTKYSSSTPWYAFTSVVVSEGSSGEIGVPACDRYLVNYRHCVNTRMPEAAREQTLGAIQESADAWKELVASDAGGLRERCLRALDFAKVATEAFGCGWDLPAPRRELTRRAKKMLARRAKVLHLQLARSGDVEALSLEPGEFLIRLEPTPGADLDPTVVATLESLEPGEMSEPFIVDGAHRIVVLEERWDAGPLPFEVVREDLENELEYDLSYRRGRLLDELRARYPVRIY